MDRQDADYNRVVAELKNNLKIPTLTLKHVIVEDEGKLKIENSKIEVLLINSMF